MPWIFLQPQLFLYPVLAPRVVEPDRDSLSESNILTGLEHKLKPNYNTKKLRGLQEK